MPAHATGRHVGRLLRLFLMLGAVSLLSLAARSESDAADSLPQVQAKYLINFVAFTTWPEPAGGLAGGQAGTPRVIGVLGDEFGAIALEEFAARRSVQAGSPITVRRIRQTDDLAGCHVLLVGDGFDTAKWSSALNGLRSQPVLTVGSGRIFAQRHGLVGLYLAEGRLRFAVNFKRVEASGLRLSSRLLSLAEIVED
jgi:hypothetical protein